jgi:hypothetical protein
MIFFKLIKEAAHFILYVNKYKRYFNNFKCYELLRHGGNVYDTIFKGTVPMYKREQRREKTRSNI